MGISVHLSKRVILEARSAMSTTFDSVRKWCRFGGSGGTEVEPGYVRPMSASKAEMASSGQLSTHQCVLVYTDPKR